MNNTKVKGVLYSVTDSTIGILSLPTFPHYRIDTVHPVRFIHFSKIQQIKYRKKNKLKKTMLILPISLAASGFLAGYFSGLGTEDTGLFNFTPEFVGIMGAAFFGVDIGLPLSIAIGNAKQSIWLNGDKGNYELNKSFLQSIDLIP